MEQYNQPMPQNQPEPVSTNTTPHVVVGNKNNPKKIPKGILITIVILVSSFIVIVLGYLVYANIFKEDVKVSTPINSSSNNSIDNNASEPYIGIQEMRLIYINPGVNTEEYFGKAVRNKTLENQTINIVAYLPEPPTGAFYQAWLIKETKEKIRPLGKLAKIGDNYELVIKTVWKQKPFGSWDELSNTIVVTLELLDDDEMEETVLRGTFRKPK